MSSVAEETDTVHSVRCCPSCRSNYYRSTVARFVDAASEKPFLSMAKRTSQEAERLAYWTVNRCEAYYVRRTRTYVHFIHPGTKPNCCNVSRLVRN